MTIRHRLYALERLAGPAPTSEPPPPPLFDPGYYVGRGLLKFDGPCRLRNISLFDPVGDIGVATTFYNWSLRHDPCILILLDSDEISHAIDALAGGYLAVKDGRVQHTGKGAKWYTDASGIRCYGGSDAPREYYSLDHSINIAIQAWADQGEPVDLTHDGVAELLELWRASSICSEF